MRPDLVLALGVTAAQSLTGRRSIVLSRERGRLLELPGGHRGMVTIHPSALLRIPTTLRVAQNSLASWTI